MSEVYESSEKPQKRYFVGITGASGVVYGVRLAQALAELGHRVDVSLSDAGERVLAIEHDLRRPDGVSDARWLVGAEAAPRVRLLDNRSIEAGPASGTYPLAAAAICPCSMGTLGRIASGYSSCLIERVADVQLKERRSLVLVPRETPLSRIHLDHLNRLAWAGATIAPAMPAFYTRPRSIEELVDHLVAKVMDAMGVPHDLVRRWGMPKSEHHERRAPKLPTDPGPRPDLEPEERHDLGEGCDA